MKNSVMLVLTLFCMQLQAQIITIVDAESSRPMELVKIVSTSPKANALTNVEGQADITSFQNSSSILIHYYGYQMLEVSYDELEKNNFLVYMNFATTQLDEMVISASKWSQSSKDVPFKVTSITPKEVALQNPQTAADLLATSGEVFMQKSQQGGGSPMIRGFATNRLLYTVDGVRMNTAIFRGGNIQNVISMDPFTIEDTEVFFGPGSVIYGSDAIGGVMSFQTLTPQFSLTDKPLLAGAAVSRFSSANNEITNHFHVNVGWKKWASITSFSYHKFGDLRMGSNGPESYLKLFYVQRMDSVDRVVTNPDPMVQNPTGYNQVNLMQKLRYQPSKNWDLQYGFHYSETSEYGRYDRAIELRDNGLPRVAIWNYGPQIWMMNNLKVSYDAEGKLYDQLVLRLAQQYFQESRIDRRFNHHRLRTQLEEVNAYSANLDFEKKVNKHTFFYGLEYVMNDVNSNGSAVDIRDGSEILVPDRYPNSTWSTYAAYFNYQYRFSEKFMMQAGARYAGFDINSDFTRHLAFYPFDFTSSRTQNAASTGSLGIVATPSKTWKISANLSTGFRAPNVDDIGKIFDFVGGQVIVPNTNLKAEYAYNGELTISKLIGKHIKLDATSFYTYLDNAMVRRTFQVNGQDSILYDGEMSEVYAIQNAAYGTVYGFNAGVEVKLPSGFSLLSRYNYQVGQEEMDNGDLTRSRHAAPAFGVTRLTYQKQGLMLQLYAMYSAEVSYENLNEGERQKAVIYAADENGNPYSPSWYTLNVKALYQFHENFTISAGLENITDQRYRSYSSGFVAPGRNMIISLRAKL